MKVKELHKRVEDSSQEEQQQASLVCDVGAQEGMGCILPCWVAADLLALPARNADRVGWIACDVADEVARDWGHTDMTSVEKGERRRQIWEEAARRLRRT